MNNNEFFTQGTHSLMEEIDILKGIQRNHAVVDKKLVTHLKKRNVLIKCVFYKDYTDYYG